MLGYIGSAHPEMPDTMPRWFQAVGTSSQAIFERFHGRGVPGSMFHYTTTAALISIVENNEIWLSDATFLNDRTEIDHGFNCALLRLKAAINGENNLGVAAMLSATLGLLETQPKPPVYIACFSWDGDDLGQWRGYGKGGTPVAVELEIRQPIFGYTDGTLSEVRYDAGEQEWIFDKILEAYRSSYAEDLRDPRPTSRKGPPLSKVEEDGICAGKLHYDLWRYIVSCKSPAFRPEREVRFVYIAYETNASWFPGHPEPMFRESAGRIIPYLSSRRLDIPGYERNSDIPRLPIKSVRIGPKEEQALIARGVRLLLDANSYADAEVLLTNNPFRG